MARNEELLRPGGALIWAIRGCAAEQGIDF